jgi:DNA gyrase subunit A
MTKVANFEVKHRGGMGIKIAVVDKKTGNIVDVREVSEEVGEVLAISEKGITIRVGIDAVPTLGRATKGVRIMKLADGDSVASVALIPKETEEKEDK